MSRISILVSSALVAALLGWGRDARADLRVVATVPDLAAIARDIGGSHASVTALSLHTQDPHFVDAKPSLALELNKADLLLAVGMDLEVGWLPTLLTGARNGDIQVGSRGYLDCSRFVTALDVPAASVDRSAGDVHRGGNPHYLHDPRAAAKVARGIADRMSELDPDHAEAYANNVTAFVDKLDQARKGWESRLASARGVAVIGYHKSWVYLADWLGLVEVAFLEPKPGVPPSPSHVAKVLVLARKQKVKLVLQEEYYPDDTAKLVADKVPAALLRLPAGANFKGGQGYLERIEAAVQNIEDAL
jgi:zinc/manganese transport system substrate-binding protein